MSSFAVIQRAGTTMIASLFKPRNLNSSSFPLFSFKISPFNNTHIRFRFLHHHHNLSVRCLSTSAIPNNYQRPPPNNQYAPRGGYQQPLRRGNPNINTQFVPEQRPAEDVPLNVSIDALFGYCREGKMKESLDVLGALEKQGIRVEHNIFLALVQGCAAQKAAEEAKRLYDHFLRTPFRHDVYINNRLIDMFSSCGSTGDARKVFDRMPERDLESWNILIKGFAANGQGDDALQMFKQLRGVGGRPDGQTYVGVLAACASLESVEEGFIHFESMTKDYGIVPGDEHYVGMIEVLGMSGHLNEAEEFISRMPVEPSSNAWEALMNLARMQGDMEMEDRIEELLLVLDPSKVKPKPNIIPAITPKPDVNQIERVSSSYYL